MAKSLCGGVETIVQIVSIGLARPDVVSACLIAAAVTRDRRAAAALSGSWKIA
jgi:hypothetical protein